MTHMVKTSLEKGGMRAGSRVGVGGRPPSSEEWRHLLARRRGGDGAGWVSAPNTRARAVRRVKLQSRKRAGRT